MIKNIWRSSCKKRQVKNTYFSENIKNTIKCFFLFKSNFVFIFVVLNTCVHLKTYLKLKIVVTIIQTVYNLEISQIVLFIIMASVNCSYFIYRNIMNCARLVLIIIIVSLTCYLFITTCVIVIIIWKRKKLHDNN